MKVPSAFISHGGGPWPLLDFDFMDKVETQEMRLFMESISDLTKSAPRAIVIISAHWEEEVFTINTKQNHELFYDYFGFPDEAFNLDWYPSNNLSIVNKIKLLLEQNDINYAENDERGLDHGVFVPMKLAWPKAEMPIIQISLKKNLDPIDHLELGKALAPLKDEDILILGSGNSFHNLKDLFNPSEEGVEKAKVFDQWLRNQMTRNKKSMNDCLINWKKGPYAEYCHPKEEHLIPLMVVAGTQLEGGAETLFTGSINGFVNTSFKFY